MAVLSDDQLRAIWREAGGTFHGPLVEHGSITEAQLLPFLRSLLVPWRPVANGLPKLGDAVLVCGPRCPVMESRRTQGWGRNAHRTYWAGLAQASDDYITHWQPMPKRPAFTQEGHTA